MSADEMPRQRRMLMIGALLTGPVASAIWYAAYAGLPMIAGMDDVAARLVFALKCICVATLFCLLAGTEAVSHERLFSPAIDPLAGHETPRLRVNLRYLQNTLEQWILFASGLLGLAAYCADGSAMRAVAATTIVWVLSRWAFWIGYHQGSRFRAFGLAGMAQSLIVLIYVCARFAYDCAGVAGAVGLIGTFSAIEVLLVAKTMRPPKAT